MDLDLCSNTKLLKSQEQCYALACHRARSRTGFGSIQDNHHHDKELSVRNQNPIQMEPKLWPLLLSRPTRAFRMSPVEQNFQDIASLTKSDASIYQLLVDDRESLVGVLMNNFERHQRTTFQQQ